MASNSVHPQPTRPGSREAPTNRRDFLKVTGTAAAALALPLASGSGSLAALPEQPVAGSPPVFLAGGQRVEARQLTVGEVEVQYFECGNPAGPPLVLVHGFPDSPLAWQGVVAELDRAKYRLVLPYLRGYGQTRVTQPDYVGGQSAALAHDLLAFTDALKLGRFHLAGHDWGARTSYAAAVLAPERLRTLTALASPYHAWRGGALPPAQVRGYWYQLYFQVEAARAMLTEHRADFCRELWHTWSPQWHFPEAEFAAAAPAWDNPQFVDVVLDYYRMRWGGALSRRAYAELQAQLDTKPQPKIAVPTIFIHGAADACDLPAGADGQEAAFPAGYERVLLPGVGHFPHRENPGAVAEAIRRQLQGPH